MPEREITDRKRIEVAYWLFQNADRRFRYLDESVTRQSTDHGIWVLDGEPVVIAYKDRALPDSMGYLRV